jgi:DNA-binding response OmpR family regulator
MKNVLVVEDSNELLEFFSTLLNWHGFNVETAYSRETFTEKLGSFQPDIVIMDVKLGIDDGRYLCRDFREKNPQPVILVSANPELTLNYREWGASDFVEKPFEINDLISKINQLVVKIP